MRRADLRALARDTKRPHLTRQAAQRHSSRLLTTTMEVLHELSSGRVEHAAEHLQTLARDA